MAWATFPNRLVRSSGRMIPLPRVLKHPQLHGRAGATLLGNEHVIVLGALEGRVEVCQVQRLILDVAPQDIEGIPLVAQVVCH
jgi:hypothetical protein